MRTTLHLQNVLYEGCAQNIRVALEMIEGVRTVEVDRQALMATVLYDPPATVAQLREQLSRASYLAPTTTTP